MGHERVGILPRRKPWLDITNNIRLSLSDRTIAPSDIGRQVLEKVRKQYEHLHTDSGVQAAFSYLIALSTSTKPANTDSMTNIDVSLQNNPSPLKITSQLKEYVNHNKDSSEYAELAIRAAADAIIYWTKAQSDQKVLFQDTTPAQEIWHNISGREFCEVSRIFFARLTERYLRYFLERSLSAQTNSLKARENFSNSISTHINDISLHAFETSKITQSFAAGWFNKYANDSRPTDEHVKAFLKVASGKLREELLREQYTK